MFNRFLPYDFMTVLHYFVCIFVETMLVRPLRFSYFWFCLLFTPYALLNFSSFRNTKILKETPLLNVQQDQLEMIVCLQLYLILGFEFFSDIL